MKYQSLLFDLKCTVLMQVAELMQRTEAVLREIRKKDIGVRRAHGQRLAYRSSGVQRGTKRLKRQGPLILIFSAIAMI